MKTTIIEEAYIKIPVDIVAWGKPRTDAQIISDMKEIEAEARQLHNLRGLTFDYEILHKDICTHCRREWEEDPETGQPECCAAAIAEWRVPLVASVLAAEATAQKEGIITDGIPPARIA